VDAAELPPARRSGWAHVDTGEPFDALADEAVLPKREPVTGR
jgi:hypothetical protein